MSVRDAGDYEISVSNTVGIQKASARLTVISTTSLRPSISIDREPQGFPKLRLRGLSGRHYIVEESDTLNPVAWRPVEIVAAGSGDSVISFRSSRTRFFRASFPSDLFTVNTLADFGTGSLRQALMDAAARSNDTGIALIRFNIPGEGVQKIRLTSPLPLVGDRIVVDGYSQPGARENSIYDARDGSDAQIMVALDGGALANSDGLVVVGRNSLVRGLALNRFQNAIVLQEGSFNSSVQGNFVGIDDTSANVIGNSVGVLLDNVSGNFVGGQDPWSRNLISGNASSGVFIRGRLASSNIIRGNIIGPNRTAQSGAGNRGPGIQILDGVRNRIGDPDSNAPNVIAFNTEGVWIAASSGDSALAQNNVITGNQIYRNTRFGIDLSRLPNATAPDGINQNDPGDADAGPNRLQNSPVLLAATLVGTDIRLQYSLDSLPANSASPIRIEVFRADSAGQGAELSSVDFYSQAALTRAITFAADGIRSGDLLVATATDASGNTSEFSSPVAASPFDASPVRLTIKRESDALSIATAAPGLNLELQTSVDLIVWVDLLPIPAATGVVRVPVVSSGAHFYRAHRLP
jgi:hypothetical protein